MTTGAAAISGADDDTRVSKADERRREARAIAVVSRAISSSISKAWCCRRCFRS